MNNTAQFLDIKTISERTGCNIRTLRRYCKNNKVIHRNVKSAGCRGQKYEILISSLEPELQEKIHLHTNIPEGAFSDCITQPSVSFNLTAVPKSRGAEASACSAFPSTFSYPNTSFEGAFSGSPFPQKVLPCSAKTLSYAKYNIVLAWENFRKDKPDKKEADKNFMLMYNSGILLPDAFKTAGKISLKSLYRWNKTLKDNEFKPFSLINNYSYKGELQLDSQLTDEEKQDFNALFFNDSKMNLGAVYKLLVFKYNREGKEIKSIACYRKYVNFIKKYHYDAYVFSREGNKAYNDKAGFYLHRDTSGLEPGTCLIADGNQLDFMVINPFTGRPCRASLIVFLDWCSRDIAGYEIMVSENTQCIASALRNSILRLGKIPKRVYIDNGRAFRGTFFTGSKDFNGSDFQGIYKNLGIETMIAQAYNGRAKRVERFFRDFVQSCPPLTASYIGNCIEARPAHLRRNEEFHKELHKNNKTPSIQQAKQIIEAWLSFYRSQKSPDFENKTIGSVFDEGRGAGVDETMLDELMMKAEKRTVKRNIIRIFGLEYSSAALYGFNTEVIIKYSLFDITKIKAYTLRGQFIGEIPLITYVKAIAKDGSALDMYNYKQELKRQKEAKKLTIKKTKLLMGGSLINDVIPLKLDAEPEVKLLEDKRAEKKVKYEPFEGFYQRNAALLRKKENEF